MDKLGRGIARSGRQLQNRRLKYYPCGSGVRVIGEARAHLAKLAAGGARAIGANKSGECCATISYLAVVSFSRHQNKRQSAGNSIDSVADLTAPNDWGIDEHWGNQVAAKHNCPIAPQRVEPLLRQVGAAG